MNSTTHRDYVESRKNNFYDLVSDKLFLYHLYHYFRLDFLKGVAKSNYGIDSVSLYQWFLFRFLKEKDLCFKVKTFERVFVIWANKKLNNYSNFSIFMEKVPMSPSLDVLFKNFESDIEELRQRGFAQRPVIIAPQKQAKNELRKNEAQPRCDE